MYRNKNKLSATVNDKLIHVQVGDEEIKATPTHPFWVIGLGWVNAGDLQVGDKLLLSSGQIEAIDEITEELLKEPIKVYNFEVEDWHTYFVSEKNILVHNTCSKPVSNKSNTTTSSAVKNRKGSYTQAKDRAGVPRSQQSSRQWTVGDDATRSGYKNYKYDTNPTSHGRYYEYDTPNGKRVIVDHTNDAIQGKHMHAGRPKGNSKDMNYDFKTNRYQKIIGEDGDWHIRY